MIKIIKTIFVSSLVALSISAQSTPNVAVANAATHKQITSAAEESFFNFYCDSYTACPLGSYQLSCPWCYTLGATKASSGYIQCVCFNEEKQLQDATLFHSLFAECNPSAKDHPQLSYNAPSNQLICNKDSSFTPPQQLPDGLVDFEFYCANVTGTYGPSGPANNCPVGTGNYQQYCSRCSYDNSSSFLNCMCFNQKKQQMSAQSFLQTNTCKNPNNINVNPNNGQLTC